MTRAFTLTFTLTFAFTGCLHTPEREVPVEKPGPQPTAPNATAPNAQPTPPDAQPAPPADGGVALAPPSAPRPAKVRILVRSIPPKARVAWGKKQLGPTPVALERPRDSGPVDLVVRADGYFPVHTRAYTFRNDAILVRLTKLADRMTLFGAREELPPPPPDGGVPPAPPDGGAAPP